MWFAFIFAVCGFVGAMMLQGFILPVAIAVAYYMDALSFNVLHVREVGVVMFLAGWLGGINFTGIYPMEFAFLLTVLAIVGFYIVVWYDRRRRRQAQ